MIGVVEYTSRHYLLLSSSSCLGVVGCTRSLATSDAIDGYQKVPHGLRRRVIRRREVMSEWA